MPVREPKPSVESQIRVVPGHRATQSDLELIFGNRGPGATCNCQRYKLAPKESFRSVTAEVLRLRLIEQSGCGTDGPETSGLVGYLGDEPVGWCAVEPRPEYVGLVRVFRVPWDGRDEDRTDRGVWAITCLFTRAGYRRRGVSRAMAKAAVEFAEDRGADAVEAYPTVTTGAMPDELHVGVVNTFSDAGLREITRPSKRRIVMRRDFPRR